MVHGMRLIRYREIMHRDEECGAGVYEWAGGEVRPELVVGL